MNQITVFADTIAIVLLIVILAGVYVLLNTASAKRDAFIICVLVDLFFAIVDLGVAISSTKGIPVNNIVVIIILLLSNYIATYAFIHYIGEVLRERGRIESKLLKSMKLFIAALSFVVLLLAISGDSIVITEERVKAGLGQRICLFLLIIFYIVMFIHAIGRIRTIGKIDVLTLTAYLSAPTIVMGIEAIFRDLHLGQLYFGFSCLFLFWSMAAKAYNAHEKENLSYFKSIASSYATMQVIDLEKGFLSSYGAHSPLQKYMETYPEQGTQEILWGAVSQRVCEAHKAEIMDFTRLNTLEERMKGIHKLSTEVLNVDDRWHRFSFVRVGEIDQKLERVIFTAHDVDNMRRSEESLKLMSTTDELTKLRNRRAFQADLDLLNQKELPDDLWYMNIDLNGLKILNDSKGHNAGDELIVALSKCITKAIYPWGKAYRIGGDEFVAIINTSKANMDVILQSLETYRSQWRGKYSDSFTFSKGVVSAQEFPGTTIKGLAIEADKRMYEDKRKYYGE